ncbi:MAG: hypothetical protein QM401_07360 [Bacillota bacterium]|nr:hypothetical protein [Bacillota bacterium]
MNIDWDNFHEKLLEEIGTAIDKESLTYAISSVAVDVVTIALEKYHELLTAAE